MCESKAKFEKIVGSRDECLEICGMRFSLRWSNSILCDCNCNCERKYWQGEYFRWPPPIILIFGYVIENRKIRNTWFFIFPRFYIWGWKLRSKLGLKNHFCGKNGLFENLGSQSYFGFKDTKFVHWHYSPISRVLEIRHKNDFSTLTLNAVFTPQIWNRGKIKKHVFLIFRSSITYPKMEMIGGGHLKYSPCETDTFVVGIIKYWSDFFCFFSGGIFVKYYLWNYKIFRFGKWIIIPQI